MSERTPIMHCPQHAMQLVQVVSGNQLQVYCPAPECPVNWVFSLPRCDHLHCMSCDAQQVQGVPCTRWLEVKEIYPDRMAWVQCAHRCRGTNLVASPLGVPPDARIVAEPAIVSVSVA